MKITKRQLRRVIKEFFGTREKSAIVAPAYKRAPELRAILDAAEMAHSSKDISYSQLKNFLFDLNATYATDRKIMEITRTQLRRIIKEASKPTLPDLDPYYNEGFADGEQGYPRPRYAAHDLGQEQYDNYMDGYYDGIAEYEGRAGR